jgi:hypothetical protein
MSIDLQTQPRTGWYGGYVPRVRSERPTAVPAPPDPTATLKVIVEHLLTGGASDLRTATRPLWIVGHAPTGTLFELYEWPGRGYYVSRRLPSGEPVQALGIFPSWKVAAHYALRA